MKAIPLRYLPWMLRDLVVAQGAVLVATGILAWLIMSRISPTPSPATVSMMVPGFLGTPSLLFLLYCSAAIVSNDRVHGYYRSFFSRPLSPAWYYFIRWLLGGVFFLALVPALTLGLSLAIGPVPVPGEVMAKLALSYLVLGGLIFFFSAFVRYDWLLAMAILMVQGTLYALRKGGVDLSAFWDFVLTVLPPIYQASLNEPMPAGPGLTHQLLYGTGLVVAAVALLRLRPLGSGGRS